jgi:DNA anti-recombination protein RmuC
MTKACDTLKGHITQLQGTIDTVAKENDDLKKKYNDLVNKSSNNIEQLGNQSSIILSLEKTVSCLFVPCFLVFSHVLFLCIT